MTCFEHPILHVYITCLFTCLFSGVGSSSIYKTGTLDFYLVHLSANTHWLLFVVPMINLLPIYPPLQVSSQTAHSLLELRPV